MGQRGGHTLFVALTEGGMEFEEDFIVAGGLHEGIVVLIEHEDLNGPSAHREAGLRGGFLTGGG